MSAEEPESPTQLVRRHILGGELVRATFSGPRKGASWRWRKVVIRPVELTGRRHLQFTYYDPAQSIDRNLRDAEAREALDQLLGEPFKNLHVATTERELQVRVSRKGKLFLHEREHARVEPQLRHDRRKAHPLPADRPSRFLEAIGVMTPKGRVRPSKQKKFKQINEFLKLLGEADILTGPREGPIEVLDLGCGNAYLTFAAYHYLNDILGRPTRVTGVDRRPEPLAKHRRLARELGWTELTFLRSSIAELELKLERPPDVALALHACDVATDEALAKSLAYRSRLLLVAPCCHHHLQAQLRARGAGEAARPLLRHGVLAERFGDVLTDSLRALILRLLGYKTQVLQFIAAEHTPRNLLIRATRAELSAPQQLQQEYRLLKDTWGVRPKLEELLSPELRARLS